jgi:hypothetical protein
MVKLFLYSERTAEENGRLILENGENRLSYYSSVT